MTQTKRLFLNIVASHGRSLYVLVCGLLTGRWSLLILGEVDYGLLALVGGLVFFISFINSTLSSSVVRFYAYAVGVAKTDLEKGFDECRRWFNVALLIHTVVPTILMAIGFPIGDYVIRHVLSIPADKVIACVWIFRFSCFSCFVSMICVPFQAMYTARQYIAELTLYSFFQTTANICVLCYMLRHPGTWLTWMAAWLSIINAAPLLIIAVRSRKLFPECRLRVSYMVDWFRIKQLLGFSGWRFFGMLGFLARSQGIAILINTFFGPQRNAAWAVSNSIAGRAQNFANEVDVAFSPAITSAFGARDYKLVHYFANQCCKFSGVLILLMVIPLTLELPEIMRLWLEIPPEYSVGLCFFMLWSCVLGRLTSGHEIVISASGRIALSQIFVGLCMGMTLVGSWFCCRAGFNLYALGWVYFAMTAARSLIYIIFAKQVASVAVRPWIRHVLLPLIGLALAGGCVGMIPRLWMPVSFIRVVLSAAFAVGSMLAVCWSLVLNYDERRFVLAKYSLYRQKLYSGIKNGRQG